MFLDKELKSIKGAKSTLSTCCDLQRRLFDMEVQSIWGAVHSRISNLALGLTVVEQMYYFFKGRTKNP